MGLERRTPLRSGKPLARRTPLRAGRASLARGAPMRRGGPLPAMSAKRAGEHDAREAVRRTVIARDGEQCAGRAVLPGIACSGPLDLDEITQRGVRPGGHLDPENCQLLCRFGHHRWKTEHAVEAVALGLRRWSWQ